MAVVPMPNGPQVTPTISETGGFRISTEGAGLLEGRSAQETSKAFGELKDAVDEAYRFGSEVRADKAFLDIQTQVNDLMMGKNGALTKVGVDVTGGVKKKSFIDHYSGEIDRIIEANGKDFDPYQKSLLKERSRTYIERQKQALINHQIKEYERLDKETQTTLLSNAVDSVAVNITDENAVKDSMAEIDRRIDKLYRTSTPEVREAKRKAMKSAALASGISMLLDNRDTISAALVFDKAKADGLLGVKEIKAIDGAIGRAKLEDASILKAESIYNREDIDTLGKALEATKEIEDADLRKKTERHLREYYAREKGITNEKIKDTKKRIYQAKLNGQDVNVSDLEFLRENDPQWVSNTWRKIEQNDYSTQSIFAGKTDTTLFGELLSEGINNPGDFSERTLEDYAAFLTKKDFDRLVDLQKKGQAKGLSLFLKTVTGKISASGRRSWKMEKDEILKVAQDTYNAFVESTGKVPTASDMTALASSVLSSDVNNAWFSGTSGRDFYAVPQDYATRIDSEDLRLFGDNATPNAREFEDVMRQTNAEVKKYIEAYKASHGGLSPIITKETYNAIRQNVIRRK